MDKERIQQEKKSLRELIAKEFPVKVTGLSFGTLKDTFPGTGGELEEKLFLITDAGEDSCFRIYLLEKPAPEVLLPATYRGVPLGYIVSDEFKAF